MYKGNTMRWRPVLGILGALLLGLAVAKEESSSSSDSSSDSDFPRIYHGSIPEDATAGYEVEIAPNNPILARDTSKFTGDLTVCGYTIYKKQSDLPFRVEVTDKTTGAAKILLNDGEKLDYERQRKYKFEIAPHDCFRGKHADREEVHIKVLDVNEYGPQLSQDTYLVEVPEGQLVDEILRLKATDPDGSSDYSSICHYHIWTEDVPFRIDSRGVLYNTEMLDYSLRHNFLLDVVVQDCGGRFSNKIIINIKVVEACKAGWKGWAERMDYSPGTGQKLLGADTKLEKCDKKCEEKQVSARIYLTTKHIGKGCDRDTYSIQSQRKLCGAASESVDLLPTPSLNADWTEDLPTDDGQEQDQMFYFDGKTNAIEIPSTKLNHTLESRFTISTWMKHEQNPNDIKKKGSKEHILCNADGEQMNRHHYSLFIHNCRLVFLLRQEPNGQDLNVFKPAEWRWKIPQICDGQWHHYSINVDFPQVRLFIDGKLFVVSAKNNPEVIDDWPLHPTKKVHFTKLVVGACWQGGQDHLSQYFSGYMAGLSILRGKTETDRVIRCLNDCKEKLDFHAMNEMESGMSVAFNSEMTEITINGRNRTEVEHLMRRVGYINTRMFPTPGHRNIRLETDVTCTDDRKLQIPDLNSMVLVARAEKPIITISGSDGLARDEHNYTRGVKLFQGVQIISQTRKEAEELDDDIQNALFKDVASNRYRLDSCTIKPLQKPLDIEDEKLKIPVNLINDLMLTYTNTAEGLVISGAEVIGEYEDVIRSIQYIHRNPQNINSRTFSLICSELNGRFVSNDFTVTLDIIHTVKHAQVPQAHAQKESFVKNSAQKLVGKQTNFHSAVGVAQTSNVGVTLIVVVCVGFLLFMIILGVIRIRAAHQRTQVVSVDGEKDEMEWDNSALTITVNPMEQEGAPAPEVFGDEAEIGLHVSDSETEDDEDEAHYDHGDDLESSEEEQEKLLYRDLEWDDSDL